MPKLAQSSGLPTHVWLASKSPRRRELLQTLGVEVDIFLAQTGDAAEALEEPLPGEHPLNYVQRITELKLNTALQAMRPQGLQGVVLASDTTVALGDTILGKPTDAEEARRMLKALSGQTHQVHTGVAVTYLQPAGHNNPTGPATSNWVTVQSSLVTVSELPDAFITAYIASGEPFDKAGGYGIQGVFGQYVSHISGSHSGIMGLPLFETSQLLRALQTAETQRQSNSKLP
ncbi:Maf family protein [Limnobacter humi]|uniref:dTTP/UTP pyrophosphatase n=1 Tax=Limnobacter humi TaxID=1778671 RepID=A0ABT1WC87_9BURK|nr:Maf family protein [Limnobacter humi]MCQ8895129.1 Maf family protein [Limnobacter humi]